MHKVLVLGGSGLIGKAIISEMNKYKEFQVYATYFKNSIPLIQDRSFKLNIEDLDNINSILNYIKPQSIVSCLRGDYYRQLSLHIKIAEHLKESGGRLYFVSTANIFDNDMSKPHYESDLPNFFSDYGKYKIACEKIITEMLDENACIIRLPQVWGKDSPRMKRLLDSLLNREKIVVYPKLFLNTNTDILVAKQLCYIIEHNLKGIFHLSAEDVVTHKDFYNELILGLGFNNARIEENFKEEGYFALLSERSNVLPERLRITNKWVINYLVN